MDVLERNWWAIGLRGIVAILFGIAALTRPLASLIVLVALFGAWWLVDGVFAIIAAVYAAEHRLEWWPLLVEGGIGLLLGAAVYFLPGMSTLALVMFIAGWFVVTGLFRVIAAIRLRERWGDEWLMILSGAMSVLFGALVWVFPFAGAVGVVVGVGAFATIFGVMQLIVAGRLFGLARWHRTHPIA